MISLEKKKEVFTLWFVEGKGKRETSRITGISRDTVNKIILECQSRIKELNLQDNHNLIEHIDSIVLKSEKKARKPYKLNEGTLEYMEKLVQENEHNRKLELDNALSIKDLFHKRFLKSDDPKIVKDITIDTFYKYVRKIKNDIYNR